MALLGQTGIDAATAGQLDSAIQKLNLTWLNAKQIFEQTLTGAVATFDYQTGDEIKFWMRLAAYREQKKSLTAQRDWSETGKVLAASVGYNRYDLHAEQIPISSTSDPYGIFLQFAENATDYFTRFPLRRVVNEVLQSNPVCLFDGLPLFSSAHKIDPTAKVVKTFSNDLTFKISETGWSGLKDAIIQIPAPNGYLANATMGVPEIWVPTDAMHVKFAKLFGVGNGGSGGTFQAKDFTTYAASESITVTSRAIVRTVPELLAGKDIDSGATLDADAALHYYVFLNTSSVDRGVVVRMPRPMTVKRSSGGADDLSVAESNTMRAWSDCEAGFAPGLPQKVFRVRDA